jgi:hypothetical protein
VQSGVIGTSGGKSFPQGLKGRQLTSQHSNYPEEIQAMKLLALTHSVNLLSLHPELRLARRRVHQEATYGS